MTILLVEDDDAVRNLTALMLQPCGYLVLVAASGEEALRLVDQLDASIDLLVTDVVLPGMRGPQLAETLRGRFPQMKALFSTGFTDDAAVRRGLTNEQGEFLSKPYTSQTLVERVRQLLEEA